MVERRRVVAVVPCSDPVASEQFYGLLGLRRDYDGEDYGDYVMLSDTAPKSISPRPPRTGSFQERIPFGLYFYADDVEELADSLKGRLLHPPKQQALGMFEFAVSDRDEHLVRVGRRAKKGLVR